MPNQMNENGEDMYTADLQEYQNKKQGNGPEKPNKKHKKNAKEIMMMKIWDVILILLFTIVCGFLSYMVYNFHILPDKYMYIIIGIFMILLFIFILITWRKVPNWVVWTKRVVLVILCCGLSYGCVFARSAYDALQAITSPETTTTINVSVISLKDGEIKKIEDLEGKRIGFQNASDAENSSFVKDKLDTEEAIKDIEYVEGIDYTDLYKQLIEGNIDALIITNSYISLLDNTYPEINDQILTVASFQKEKSIAGNTSDIDIRYDPFTVYLSGVEDMGDLSEDAHNNDVNMVLFINPGTHQVQMISLPRDAFVPNPALGNVSDKLTHTGTSGIENAEGAIENLLGLEIDFYAKVNFASLIEIVDTIGGIEVDVELAFCEQDEYRNFNNTICLDAGPQILNGGQALAYSRHRKTEGYGDVGRTHAQQRIIQGIINKLLTPDGIAKVNDLLKVASTKVKTDMPMQQITNFISYQLDRVKPWTMNSMTIDSYGEMLTTASMGTSTELSCQVLDRTSAQEALNKIAQLRSQMKMQEFSFKLDDLQKETLTLPSNNGVVWFGSDLSAYKSRDSETEPVDENEDSNQNNQATPPTNPDDGSGDSGNGGNQGGNDNPQEPEPPEQPETPNPDPNPNPNPPANGG